MAGSSMAMPVKGGTRHPIKESNRWWSRCAIALLIGVFGYNYWLHRFDLIDKSNIDDGAWVYSSYYFTLAFKDFNLASPDWRHIDAFDHPPVVKYLTGLFLAASGYYVATIDYKDDFHNRSDIGHLDQLLADMNRVIPASALALGRLQSTVAFSVAGYLLFAIGNRIFSPAVGFVAALFFSLSPQIRSLAAQIAADGDFLAFLLGSVYLQFSWFERIATRQPSMRIAIALGALCALFFNTKILGIVGPAFAIGSVSAGCLVRSLNGRPCRMRTVVTAVRSLPYLDFAALILAFVSVAILINPTFYDRPIATIACMFPYRWAILDLQFVMFPHLTFPTPELRASAFLQALFVANDPVPPLILGLSMIGLFHWLGSARSSPATHAMLAANMLGWIAITNSTFVINSPRYVLWLAPFAFLLAAVGVLELTSVLRKHHLGRRVRAGFILACICFSMKGIWFIDRVNMEAFLVANPDWVTSRQAGWEAQMERTDQRLMEILGPMMHTADEPGALNSDGSSNSECSFSNPPGAAVP